MLYRFGMLSGMRFVINSDYKLKAEKKKQLPMQQQSQLSNIKVKKMLHIFCSIIKQRNKIKTILPHISLFIYFIKPPVKM